MTAIIAAAGKGTRMAAIAGGMPKELLPLGSSTVLGRIIDEAREAGSDRIVVVSSREKPAIDAYCHSQGVDVAYQDRMHGVADAIASANVVDDALIMMGDAVFVGGSPSCRLTMTLGSADGAIAVEKIDESMVRQYGICEVEGQRIRRVIEKPSPEETRSRMAVCARQCLSGHMMRELNDRCQQVDITGQAAEVSLTQIYNEMLLRNSCFIVVPLHDGERRIDCGSPDGYETARRMMWN